MTAKTIAQLKAAMPFNTPGGTTIQDMHDLLDTVEGRTTFSVKDYGAIGTDVQANAATDTAAFLAATAAAAATTNNTGAVYVPSGVYHVNPNQWIIPERMKVFGDGYGSKIRKNGNGWLLDVSGNTWMSDTDPVQERNSYTILRDLAFDGKSNNDCLLRTYYASELLIDKCRFTFNDGPAIDAVEWWDSRVQNCFFDHCGDATNASVRIRNNSSAVTTDYGYSNDSSNAIYFYGCRWESFIGGAIWIETGPEENDHISQMYFTNCKCETDFFAGPIIRFNTTVNKASNIHFDQLFVTINSVNPGYATVTDVIDWRVNQACSIRNLFCYIGGPAATSNTIRSVIRSNLSFSSSTLENIYLAGTKPAGAQFLGIVAINSTSEPKMIGHIGCTESAVGATAVNGGGAYSRTLTAARAATLLDDGLLYRNSTETDVVVTLAENFHPGWKCRALQTTAGGTITFQKVAASGATFIFENGTDHRRTGGQNAMVEVLCISNNTTNTAAVFHVRGKTVVQAATA